MKILLNGGNIRDREEIIIGSFLRIFKELGHEVEHFPVQEYYGQKLDKIPNRYLRGLVHRLFWRQLCHGLNKQFISRIEELKPDFIFVCKGWHVSPETLKTIKKRWPDTPLFCFNQENPFNLWNISYSNPWILKSIPFYDVYFTWGKFLIDKIKDAGGKRVEYLALGFDPKFSYPIEVSEEEKKKYGSDIAFVGSWDKERDEWLSHLTDFDLKTWGGGHWQDASPRLREKWQGYVDSFPKVCASSKIVIDILRKQMQPAISLKAFETSACGGFFMSNRGGEIPDFFEEGENIVTFSDPEDMVKKIKFYLGQDELRKKISEAALKRVQGDSYVERSKRVLEIYDDFVKSKK